MPFCDKCGAAVNPNSNFCRNCGAPQTEQPQTQSNYQPVPPTSNSNNLTEGLAESPSSQTSSRQVATEQIADFIMVRKSRRFGGEEYFTGILTNTQIIFAPMSKDMIKEVTNISRQQAKANNNTLPKVYPYQQMYLNVLPSTILSQTPGCFSIQNSAIREINVKLVNAVGDGYSDFQEFEMRIITDLQTQVFRMTKRDEYIIRLKQVYQEKIRVS